MTKIKVAIGSDEAGFDLKEALKAHLTAAGVEVVDYGCDSPDPVDYPDIALDLARDIAAHKMERGILICGTGIGMAITANKVPGVRAAQAHDAYSAQRARKSNDAQIVTMGARVIAPELAKTIIDTWLESEFEGGNSARKVNKISAYDAGRAATAHAGDEVPEAPTP
jgi:ribose 5-phosphate isomerase B